DAGDVVGRGGAVDVEDLVLRGQRGELHGHAGGDRPRQDLVALADQGGGHGGGLGRVAGVVGVGNLDGGVADLAGAVGGVVETGLETLGELLAVAGDQAAGRGHQADLHRGSLGSASGRAASAGGEAEDQHGGYGDAGSLHGHLLFKG